MLSRVNDHKRVLVVEDEQSIAQLLTLLLRTRGYTVEVALTGEDALSCLSRDFDIVILDLLLPDLGGFKICQHIKANPQTQHIPIIIISGQNHNGHKLESLHLGADDYINKPFEPEELFARMDVVFRRNDASFGDKQSQRQFEVITELRHIVDEEKIFPHFQPIYHLKPFKILGFEALSRPQSTSALANPEVLFKEALKYGMYFDVEMIGWRKAIKAFREEYKLNGESLFLNCNPYLVESEKFINVRGMFHDYGMPLNKVFLEITERSAISEYDLFFERLKNYRDHGFKIAIDDVGGGYSSLESIVQTRPEVVKLDRHIVSGMGSDPFKRSIVKLIVTFCRENNIISVAEGIETKADLDILVELGVDAGQGYYLCRPKETIAGCLLL